MARVRQKKPVTPQMIDNFAEIKTRGNDWKSVIEDRIHNRPSPPADSGSMTLTIDYGTTSWVRPGVKYLESSVIISQRTSPSNDKFLDLMTPYFLRHKAVREGMVELRQLFLKPAVRGPDGFAWYPPGDPVTYEQMLSILLCIRNEIDYEKDRYPDKDIIDNARTRYKLFLHTGNRMPLMAKDEGDGIKELSLPGGSNKRKAASQGDALVGKRRKSSGKGRGGGGRG